MRKISLLACFVLCGFWCTATFAQGYSGLIPDTKLGTKPDTKAEKTDPSPSTSGYSGLLAAPGGSACTTGQFCVQKEAAEALVSKPQTNATAIPGREQRPLQGVEDLKSRAQYEGYKFTANSLDPETRKRLRMARENIAQNDTPSRRINGLLPMENTVKTMIDNILKRVKDETKKPEERKKIGQESYNQLLQMSDAFIGSSSISDDAFKSMGVSDIYIQERREANKNNIQRIRDALAILKSYQ